jgi:hypothetical protein
VLGVSTFQVTSSILTLSTQSRKLQLDVDLNNMGKESETYLQPLSHESLSDHGGAALSRLDFRGAENEILRRVFQNKLAVRRFRK